MYNNAVIAVQLPPKIQYKVIDAPPAVKGDTASGRLMKDVTLENGLKIRAPIFIKDGETVLVNAEDGSYCERINQ
jgi:elongation factor P